MLFSLNVVLFNLAVWVESKNNSRACQHCDFFPIFSFFSLKKGEVAYDFLPKFSVWSQFCSSLGQPGEGFLEW
jgi:hypothetical protein